MINSVKIWKEDECEFLIRRLRVELNGSPSIELGRVPLMNIWVMIKYDKSYLKTCNNS